MDTTTPTKRSKCFSVAPIISFLFTDNTGGNPSVKSLDKKLRRKWRKQWNGNILFAELYKKTVDIYMLDVLNKRYLAEYFYTFELPAETFECQKIFPMWDKRFVVQGKHNDVLYFFMWDPLNEGTQEMIRQTIYSPRTEVRQLDNGNIAICVADQVYIHNFKCNWLETVIRETGAASASSENGRVVIAHVKPKRVEDKCQEDYDLFAMGLADRFPRAELIVTSSCAHYSVMVSRKEHINCSLKVSNANYSIHFTKTVARNVTVSSLNEKLKFRIKGKILEFNTSLSLEPEHVCQVYPHVVAFSCTSGLSPRLSLWDTVLNKELGQYSLGRGQFLAYMFD
jgi:hypothetical protein